MSSATNLLVLVDVLQSDVSLLIVDITSYFLHSVLAIIYLN